MEHENMNGSAAAAVRPESRMPDGPEWVNTPSAAMVGAALSYAWQAGCIAAVCGGTGTGKTATCKRFERENSNVWLATMSPASEAVSGCLRAVARACGAPDRRTIAALEGVIVYRLRGRRGLLIVDEAKFLRAEALEWLRRLASATGTAVALVGDTKLYGQLANEGWIARWCLPAATPADADALAEAWGVQDAGALREARRIAAFPAGLWGLRHALRRVLSLDACEAATEESLRAAWEGPGGTA